MNIRMQALTQVVPTPSFTPVQRGFLQRKCACGTHAMGGEQCVDCAKKKTVLQRKLAIGASNDPLEQEADRIASQVMAGPAPSYINPISPGVQRFTGHTIGQTDLAPASVDRVLARSGMPVESTLRQDMEQRFGYDFSKVRVHTGDAAEQSARDVSAHAYTVGHNIVFGARQFAPGTNEGQRLLAHELTHVVQQGKRENSTGNLQLGVMDTPQEAEADQASQQRDSSTQPTVPTVSSAPGIIQRQSSDVGNLVLRLGEGGRIEVLYGTPDLPITGPLGAGIRCQNGRCQPVAGQNPADITNRTYTVQEAIDLLRGSVTTTSGSSRTSCPPDRQIPQLAACCPVGMTWDGTACVSPSATWPTFCLPSQMTPRGTCCPTGEIWNYSARRCAPPITSAQPGVQSPQLTFPQLQLGRAPIRFGTIESATFDSFRSDDAAVPSQHNASLDHLASLLNVYRDAEVHIDGHTDSTASEAHNDRLSRNRAEAVRAELTARNVVNPGRLHTQGFGEHQLLARPERNEADETRNRRVEVWFYLPPTEGPGTQFYLQRPSLF